MRSRSSLNAGFTLVEVMVSITVLSMILLATVTALRTFGNTQQSLQHMTHRVDEVRSVSGFLRAAIESATIAEDASGGLALGGTGGGNIALRCQQTLAEPIAAIVVTVPSAHP